jgi:hypothetical protein
MTSPSHLTLLTFAETTTGEAGILIHLHLRLHG